MAYATKLPLLDEVAMSLKEKRSYRKELSEQEVAQIMESVIRSVLAEQTKVSVVVSKPTVHIKDDMGTVSGNVQVESPIQATIAIDCALENAATPQHLKLRKSNVKEDAALAAMLALRALKLEQRVNEKLSDPNQALSDALASQLESRGVRLTDTGLHFNAHTLVVDLKGEPL